VDGRIYLPRAAVFFRVRVYMRGPIDLLKIKTAEPFLLLGSLRARTKEEHRIDTCKRGALHINCTG
jgi:hypothetical protein